MKKIGFFLNNTELGYLDFSNIEYGNPGIGGSEYMIVLMAHLLNKRQNNIYSIILATHDSTFPKGLDVKKVKNLHDAINIAEKEKLDYLTFKHLTQYIREGVIYNTSIKLIPWCHNFVSFKDLKFYAKHPSIYRILNVSREQMDMYLDHIAYNKSTYIYNSIDINCIERYNVTNFPFKKRNHIVTYIGSIIPVKGLHWIAEVWKDITEKVPDAELYIIGSGKLYFRNATMGHFGIAERNYENYIMKYLAPNGKILPSVHFMGIMGEEKNQILLKTKVGIPNPSGISETFGISAVEMQLMGAKIATIQCPGYLDTVFNGELYKSKKDLTKTIISLLLSDNSNYNSAIENIKNRFSHEKIAEKWEIFLSSETKETKHEYVNLNFRHKWLKIKLRKIKEQNPILYHIVPAYEQIALFINKIRKKFRNIFISSTYNSY